MFSIAVEEHTEPFRRLVRTGDNERAETRTRQRKDLSIRIVNQDRPVHLSPLTSVHLESSQFDTIEQSLNTSREHVLERKVGLPGRESGEKDCERTSLTKRFKCRLRACRGMLMISSGRWIFGGTSHFDSTARLTLTHPHPHPLVHVQS